MDDDKYVKESYFDQGITDETAIRIDMGTKQIQVTTTNLTIAMECLRAAQPAGTPPRVAQVAAATDAAADAADVSGMKTAAAVASAPAAKSADYPATQPIYPANAAGNVANLATSAAILL